ncbi:MULTISPECIES: glycosyltransferase family 2 protein [unclassified Agarivorans]|uniref:glycosyltransferase family 2 protein n=1 Tax=unclassified Agarivorans TaxID=2636026 RepID=UPI0026E16367|nr:MULTISPECIES: glycosyltransferase family 2 protein [unclassified Agarivorans]MDO6688121.1 glycosyltransferase family 2 protein [Agarivorans sp. 3_MG-2023]MDO6717753.1 glycosyltransferase family 2 protein [Agarivorans sp. 2_MG-2023]
MNGEQLSEHCFINELTTRTNKSSAIFHIQLTSLSLNALSSLVSSIPKKGNFIRRPLLILQIDTLVVEGPYRNKVLSFLNDHGDRFDLIHTTEYSTKKLFEKLTPTHVFELPHPIDVHAIRPYPRTTKSHDVLVLMDKHQQSEALLLAIENLGFRTRTFNSTNKEKQLIPLFTRHSIVVAPYDRPSDGEWMAYAALAKCVVISSNHVDLARRFYPLSISNNDDLTSLFTLFRWLTNNSELLQFISVNAAHKVEAINHGNSIENLFRQLNHPLDKKHIERINANASSGNMLFNRQIVRSYGPENVFYKPDEFAVVCLVKEGEAYLRSFIAHYQTLGAKHFYFIDNGSNDDTVNIIKSVANTSLYITKLQFKFYETEIRRYVVEKNCQQRWCLTVDVDEFFDFPGSSYADMRHFIRYQTKQGYTSVVAYLLDLFPEKIETVDSATFNRSQHCFYDLSNIRTECYFSKNQEYNKFNQLGNKNISNYYGGIREKVFGKNISSYVLTKHPLAYIDGEIDILTDPHYCNKSKVSDVTGVLLHYKFVNAAYSYISDRVNNGLLSYYADQEYRAYKGTYENGKKLSLFSKNSIFYNSIDELIEKKFVHISTSYTRFLRGVESP